jgi:hypothetical protein
MLSYKRITSLWKKKCTSVKKESKRATDRIKEREE